MTPGVITCTTCGSEVRAGSRFCPRCASALPSEWSSDPVGGDEPNAPGVLGYTNAWDAVLPRLQQALHGEFVISRELGRGGMAAVFLAHQLRLNRKVAIKVMAPTLMSGLGLVERFRDEATTVARLDHPNIISIFEIGATAGLQYFVMQYVTGRSLERVVRQYGSLPLEVIRAIVFEVGSALAYAHRNQVIHRDVKPGNILLNLDGRVIVSDFGIAKVAASTVHTQTGVVVGTPAYMSPEQCLGRPLTWSADQYALGIVAYEMVTGVQPFGGSGFAAMRGHTEEPPPPILERRPDCPPDVVGAIERMLAKNPADRFASMHEALAALGSTRARIDDAVQATIGALAIPLPDEVGIVLVQTPASPAPQVAPAQIALRDPSAAELTLQDAAAAPGAPVPEVPNPRLRKLAAAISAHLGNAVHWGRTTWNRAARATTALTRRSWLGAVGGVRRASQSRAAIATAAAAVVMVTVGAFVVVLAGDSGRTKVARPPVVVPESALGTTAAARDSARDSLTAAPVDSLTDSLVVDAVAPVDSAAANEVLFSRNLERLPAGESLTLTPTVTDFRGNIIRRPPLRWSSSRRTVATIDSATGLVRALTPGTTIIRARAGYGEDSIRIIVQPRMATSTPDATVRTERPVEPAVVVFDEAAETIAVQAAFRSFLNDVLGRKDTVKVADLYWTSKDTDFPARDALIQQFRRGESLYVAPPQNPPQPTFTGTTALMNARIRLQWMRSRRKSDAKTFLIEAELRREGHNWGISRFRLTPAK